MFSREEKFVSVQEGESEISVWLEFLFKLTIGARLFANHPCELEQINEINHRVLNRIRDLRNGQKWSSVKDTFEMIRRHVSTTPEIEAHVARAFDAALSNDD